MRVRCVVYVLLTPHPALASPPRAQSPAVDSLVSGLIGAFIGAVAGGTGTVVGSRFFHESDQRRTYRAELLADRLPPLEGSKAEIYSSGSYHAVLIENLQKLEAYTKLLSRGEEQRAAVLAKAWRDTVPSVAPPSYRTEPIVPGSAVAAIDAAYLSLQSHVLRKLRPLSRFRDRFIDWPVLGFVDPMADPLDYGDDSAAPRE